MEVVRTVNGKEVKLSLEDAIKHTLCTDPANVAYNNIIKWQNEAARNEYEGRGFDLTLTGLMIEVCEKRAEEMGIQLEVI